MSHLLKSYPAMELGIHHARDVYLFTGTGEQYLDMYAGHAVTSTGHCHPAVVAAIQHQSEMLLFYSNALAMPLREEAAAKLIAHAPDGFGQVFFANSGAEANENALKLARNHTGRTKIVAMEGGFHGRTAGAISVTGIEKYRKTAGPLVPDVTFVPFGEVAGIDKKTAAVILEPIQSMNGCRTAPPEYFRALRKACDENGALLIYDEVQTGVGRTGTMYYAGKHGVVPDLVTLAKGLGSGVPVSAVLVKNRIAEKVGYGEYGATFGAGPVAMAAVKATLEVIEDGGLLDRVNTVGAVLRGKTEQVPGVEEVRGEGLLLGVKTGRDSKEVFQALLERKVIVGTSLEPRVLRLLPPLTLQEKHVDEFVAALTEVLAG